MKSINIRFPIVDDPDKNTYFKMNRITKDAFGSDLLFLLLTERGERFYHPEFGTNLLKYIFEPSDSLTSQDIEQEIKNTVSLYLPNLTIKKVTFSRPEDSDVTLNVHIDFTYTEDSFSENGALDLNF